MPLTVVSCVSYSAAFRGRKTEADWAALHFVNAIKGTPLAGFAQLPLSPDETVRIDRSTAASAPAWFAQLAGAAASWRELLPCALVPIPDARCALGGARPPNTRRLADALMSELGADVAVCDCLRRSRPMLTAHLAASGILRCCTAGFD